MNKKSNIFNLIFLGLIWSSFAIFTKISAENLSPFFVAFARLFLGGLLLYAVCLFKKIKIFERKNFKYYAFIGLLNSAFPFTLFALSAKNLDSAIVAILDGTIPMFEVMISIFFFKIHVEKNAIFGVILGLFGIIITSFDVVINTHFTWLQAISIIAILVATNSYAIATLYANKKCKNVNPLAMATGSVIFGAIFLLPSIFFVDFTLLADKRTLGGLLGLGLICTGIAYIFYFKLLAEESARTAVSVVLLIPIFGTIFGAIFLGEIITANKIVGCLLIVVSLKFILNLSYKDFIRTRPIL